MQGEEPPIFTETAGRLGVTEARAVVGGRKWNEGVR